MTKVLKYKFYILTFITSFLILTKFDIDPDLGWHLAYGERFLENGQIILADPFSWTMPGYVWGNSYFAYQVLTAFIFDNFGHIAASVVFSIVGAIGVLLLIKKIDFLKFLLVSLGVTAAVSNLGVRPHTISFLMFSIFLVLVEKGFLYRTKFLLMWFLFFALWANFHRGFVFGLATMGFFIAFEFMSAFAIKKKLPSKSLLALVAAILGSLVTPYPIHVWKSGVLFDLASKENLLTIAEWQPVATYTPTNVIYALSGVIFVFVLFKNFKKTKQPVWFMLSAITFAVGFLFVTFVFFWAAIFIFMMSRYFDWRLRALNFGAKFTLAYALMSAILAFMLILVVNFAEAKDLPNRLEKKGYPVGALNYLEAEKLETGLFNEYAWGGFLDWQVPSAKVFIDGRMASWKLENGQSILDQYVQIIRGNCEVTKKYDIRVVLVSKITNLDCFRDFQRVWEGDNAVMLKRI